MQRKQSKVAGFTLVEIIVSLAIFSIVAVIAVGALVRVTSANRQAQAIQSGVNNISFALDAISREMRVGKNYTCYANPSISLPSGNVQLGNLAPSCSNIVINEVSLQKDLLIVFDSSNIDKDTNSPGYGSNLKYGYLFHYDASSKKVVLYKGEETQSGEMYSSIVPFYPITSSIVSITDAKVGVYGGTNRPYQWAFIRLKGYAGGKIKDQSVFDIQTSVSQRITD